MLFKKFILSIVSDHLDAQFFFYMFISILYMFRATLCSSSVESVVSIQHLVCVTLCMWPSSRLFLPDLQTRRSPTQSDTYQMLYWYNWFSWWWAWGCSKHVENWNKHIEKEVCVKLVIYKKYTEMHGQQNIKFILRLGIFCCNLIQRCIVCIYLKFVM
jgi:hypothetical protein